MPKTGVLAVMTLALSLGSIVAFGKPNKGPKDGTNCPQRHANLGTKVCCAYDGNGDQKECHICYTSTTDADCANGKRVVSKPEGVKRAGDVQSKDIVVDPPTKPAPGKAPRPKTKQ